MKRITLLLLAFVIISSTSAQVQVRPLPKPGYDLRIKEAINQLKVVDSHEHLMSLENIKNWRYKCSRLDFMFLFSVYACDDIISAGLQRQVFNNKLMTDSLTVKEKWRVIKPYWEASSNTAYNRAILLAADKLFGVKNIDSTTVEELSDKIRLAYQNESVWFNHVLKEKCGIEYVVLDGMWISGGNIYDSNLFKFVVRFDNFIWINSKSDIEYLTKRKSTGVITLDDLVSSLEKAFQEAKDKGYVGIKSGLAYSRILFYDNVKKEKAEEVFTKIKNSPTQLSFDEVKPLQDYMMHRILDMAKRYHLPVQIHTGLNGYNIENSKPTHLINLFQEYPDVKFILFHGAFPYGGELTTIAKSFQNVYIDMCWMYIISPSYSERFLDEWLETVPANKIMAFGGDYFNVEGVYSHLLFAKQVVSNVLADKVKDGYFTEDEALKTARMILHDNAIQILNLK
jgi:uncharacterized protein